MIGILTLDTGFPRIRGDVGCADTFPFPVRYATPGGAAVDLVVHRRDDSMLPAFVEAGRALHREWVEHAFGPWLARKRGAARARLRARLVAVTDVYVWKIVRRDLGLDARETAATLRELVAAVVA